MGSPDFEPDRKVITAITNANPAVVTSAAHGYTSGDIVRINIPRAYGMLLGSDQFEITVVNANSFSIPLDSSFIDPFVVPAVTSYIAAEVLPISAETDNIA